MKRHALTSNNGPGICGAGQGQKMFQHVCGTPIDELATVESFEAHIDCKRCLARVRKRFPLWVELGRGFVKR